MPPPPSIDEDGGVAFVALIGSVQPILVAREPGATSLGDYESLGSGVAHSRGALDSGFALARAPE